MHQEYTHLGHRIHPFLNGYFPYRKPAPSPNSSHDRAVAPKSPNQPTPRRDILFHLDALNPSHARSLPDKSNDLNTSPIPKCDSPMNTAAMFLSSFSSPQAPPSLPDSEGAVVGGYTLGPIIGYGGFSTIRRAFSNSGGSVAVKIVRRADLAKQGNPTLVRKRLNHESAVWSSLSHEHILPLFSTVHSSYADYFITILCPAGSLYDILKRDGRPALPQEDVGMMFRQVIRGLRYLHEVAGVVHRDIKLENILVDEMGVCRISDFGMTARIGEFDDDDQEEDKTAPVLIERSRGRSSFLPPPLRNNLPRQRNSAPPSSLSSPHPNNLFQPGSLPYASPELLLPQTKSTRLPPHPAQDIWALGVLLYVLLTGRLPFYDSYEPRLQMKILLGGYVLPSGIGRGAERVLEGCLERSVSERWTIDMVDDVAWGIGWGSEGDDVPSAVTQLDEPESPKDQPMSNPTPSHPPTSPDQTGLSLRYNDNDVAAVSVESPRTRSSSRTKRQSSRRPDSTSRLSPARCQSCSSSRPPRHLSPSQADALCRTASSSSSTSSLPPLDSASGPSQPPLLDRGRRRSPDTFSSRSPTPGALPKTPVEADGFDISLPRAQSKSIERGREAERAVRASRRSLFGVSSHGDTDLDVLDETTRWAAPVDTKPPKSCSRAPSADATCHSDFQINAPAAVSWIRSDTYHRPLGAAERGRRAGSSPPAPSLPWSMMNRVRAKDCDMRFSRARSSVGGRRFMCHLSSEVQPNPNPVRNGARSKSVGYPHVGDSSFLPHM